MNRRMVYTGALPQDLDLNQNMQFSMVGLGFLAEAVLGQTSWAYGLTPVETTPASLTVNFGRGSLGMMSVVDQTNPGSSDIVDTTDPLMKVGVNLSATPITFTPPGTSGQSQVFLVQGQMQEADTGSEVLPYYNATTPSQPFSGPNNSGAANNTIRAQTVALQVVAGTPATTGSQVAPSVTAGWVPLYLLTLANGQTTITTAQVTVHPDAPLIDAQGTQIGIQPGRLLNVQTFFEPGTFLYPPTPGAREIIVEVQGGGGGTGGVSATSSTQISCSGGASSGAYARGRYPATAQTITVGPGGAAGASGNSSGGNGGTSSFGTLATAAGGAGTSGFGPTAATLLIAPGAGTSNAVPPAAAGGNILNVSSNPGATSFGGTNAGAAGDPFAVGGAGGGSPMAGGGIGPGSGGAGAAIGGTTSATAGNAGLSGAVIIWEYS